MKVRNHMAIIRNLRNITSAGVSKNHIAKLKRAFADGSWSTSRILPFRYIASARHNPDWEPELEQAMFQSLAGMPKLPGLTVLLVDVSGSMDAPIGGKSELSRRDAAYALGMLAREICEDVRIYTFTDYAKKVPNRRGFALRDAMNTNQSHGGTYLGQAITQIDKTENYDRLIIFTDEQTADKVGNPKGTSYLVNVASNRNGVGYKGNFVHIDGFSSSVIDWIKVYEDLD